MRESGTSLFISQTLAYACQTQKFPRSPSISMKEWGYATAYTTQFSYGIPFTNFVFYLYGLEADDGLSVAIFVSGNPFCKSCMNGIAPQF